MKETPSLSKGCKKAMIQHAFAELKGQILELRKAVGYRSGSRILKLRGRYTEKSILRLLEYLPLESLAEY